MNAGLELDDANLGLLVQISCLEFEETGPPSQTICLVCIVECVKYLHCSPSIAHVSPFPFQQVQFVSDNLRLMGRTDIPSWDSILPDEI